MDAAKAADLASLFPGYIGQQADATQAYTQAKLGGTPTWVRLPKHQWPKEVACGGMRRPGCPPPSGSLWPSGRGVLLGEALRFPPAVHRLRAHQWLAGVLSPHGPA
eukprot:5885421-Alexandrium_andersonii.AAC.1